MVLASRPAKMLTRAMMSRTAAAAAAHGHHGGSPRRVRLGDCTGDWAGITSVWPSSAALGTGAATGTAAGATRRAIAISAAEAVSYTHLTLPTIYSV